MRKEKSWKKTVVDLPHVFQDAGSLISQTQNLGQPKHKQPSVRRLYYCHKRMSLLSGNNQHSGQFCFVLYFYPKISYQQRKCLDSRSSDGAHQTCLKGRQRKYEARRRGIDSPYHQLGTHTQICNLLKSLIPEVKKDRISVTHQWLTKLIYRVATRNILNK